MVAEIVVLYEVIDASIDEELPLDEEDGEFHLISATAAFMKRDLERIAGFCEVVVPSYATDEFRSHFRMTKTTFEWYLLKSRQLACTGKRNSQQQCWRIPCDADKNWRMAQSRSQSFVPLDQRSENESSGSIHFEITKEINVQNSVSMAHAWNGCSQSSRFLTAGQGERSAYGLELAVGTFSVQIFGLRVLDYLWRRSAYFGKFPFGQTKTVLPVTSQPKFPEFFG